MPRRARRGRGECGAAARRAAGAVRDDGAGEKAAHPAPAAGVAVGAVARAAASRQRQSRSRRDLLDAARLGDKIGAFEDEEIDLDAILEAHRAGDLMDLLREVGLKAGERLRVKRALG